MSRVIHTQSPGKVRHHYRRTIAEAIRRLSQKTRVDEETKDLSALIIFCLQGIADTIDQTTRAWEKRDYYLKADRFREKWRWVDPLADQLSAVIYEERWTDLPDALMELMPHFSDISVKRLTRKPELWDGAYAKFLEDE